MVIDFSQNGMNILFEVTKDNEVVLKHFSNKAFEAVDKEISYCKIACVHISGENPANDLGAKHMGSASTENLKYVSHNISESQTGSMLEFVLCNDKIRVTVNYQAYSGISALRSWTKVENISDEVIGLEYVSSFSYTGLENIAPTVYIPHNAWMREIDWKKYSLSDLGLDRKSAFSTKRISVSNTGTWSAKEYLPMAAFEDNGTALMWQIENNGSWQWEISDIADMLYLKLSGPTDRESRWYKKLLRGESFESVKVCVAAAADFDAALDEMTKYRRQIFENNLPNKKLPVIFNDYMHCLWADPTTEKMIPVIDKAAAAGAEYYCMDAGWYGDGAWWETLGEWQPTKNRFPGGLKQVFDYIRSKKMIPGIWLEIEVMGRNCPILDEFDDECFFMRHGKRVLKGGRYQLDFRNENVRRFTMSVIDRVVGEYGAGYIKFDYNMDSGSGTEVDSDSFGDGLLEHNRAYLKWIDEIKAKYPDLILENCSSGGMRIDYAMLAKHHVQSVTDQEDYKNTAHIASAAPTALLPEQAAIWSYPLKDSDQNAVVFNMVNSMLQRVHLGGDITNLADESFGLVQEAITCYKSIRGDIADSIPFYPAGIPAYDDEWLCLGLSSKNHTRLAVWRLDSDDDTMHIPLNLKAENPKVIYPSEHNWKINATAEGLVVTSNSKYTAVLIEL